jgi:hypothetical protein
MKCPQRADGVHDCTGQDQTCGCGYKPIVSRFGFSLDVYDNKTRGTAVDDGFMTDDVGVIVDALESAIKRLRELR